MKSLYGESFIDFIQCKQFIKNQTGIARIFTIYLLLNIEHTTLPKLRHITQNPVLWQDPKSIF